MPLEAEARQEIDRQLTACGWAVQDYSALNLAAAPGIAVREFLLTVGEVDYLLYVEGKGADVIYHPGPIERTVGGGARSGLSAKIAGRMISLARISVQSQVNSA